MTDTSDDQQPDSVEPQTVHVQTVHVRRGNATAPLADAVIALLDEGRALIDLSHHNRRADTVELRATDQGIRSRS